MFLFVSSICETRSASGPIVNALALNAPFLFEWMCSEEEEVVEAMSVIVSLLLFPI